MMRITGMDHFKATQASNQVNALEIKLQRERDIFKRSDIKREIAWQMRRVIFYRGKWAK